MRVLTSRQPLFSRDRFEILLLGGQLLVPLTGGTNERLEQSLRGRVDVVSALRVPLDAENEVIGGGALDGFFDAVGGAPGDEAQSVSENVGGLMVAGVDGDHGRLAGIDLAG